MQIERGQLAAIPSAAVDSGPPLLVLSGLYPTTGVTNDGIVRSTVAPLRHLSVGRKIFVRNRWSGLQATLTMRDLADGYARAIRAGFDSPVDVVGLSTGGSIAQQLAADHPDAVRRLVLISSACRLAPYGRQVQARVAALLRDGHLRQGGHSDRRRDSTARAAHSKPRRRLGKREPGPWHPERRAGPHCLPRREDNFDLAQCPNTIQAPSLIIMGEQDRFYSAKLARETAALIPNSHLMLIARRGHLTAAASNRAKAPVAGFLAS